MQSVFFLLIASILAINAIDYDIETSSELITEVIEISSTNEKNSTNSINEQLKGLNGLRFTKIGDMQLIIEQREITFNVNFTDVRELMTLAFEEINKTIKSFENQSEGGRNHSEFIEELRSIEKYLMKKKMELDDLSFDFNAVETNSSNEGKLLRKRRGLTEEQTEALNKNFEILEEFGRDIGNKLNLMIDLYGNASKLLNDTTLEVSKQIVLNNLRTKVTKIIDKLNAVHSIQTKNRLSKEIVPIEVFKESLDEIEKTLKPDLELPYNRVSEYFYNLDVVQHFENYVLKLTITVPIVQKVKRELFLIEEFPTFYNATLQLTNVKWKYIAMSKDFNNSMTFKDLKLCTNPLKSVYLCETQSPLIKYEKSNDCATNSKRNGEIDIENCELKIFKVKHFLLIKLADGHFFYYTPNNETIEVDCNGVTEEILLLSNSTGLLKLNKGCIASNDRFVLIGRTKYEETVKSFAVDIGYDVKRLRAELANKTSPIFNQFYVESLHLIRKISQPIEHVKMHEKPLTLLQYGSVETASVAGGIFLSIFLLCSLIVFIKGRKSEKKKSKNTMKQKTRSESI